MFIQAAGLWNKTLFREYIVAGLNLVLDVVLVGKYGIGGIVFSSFFSNFFVGLPLDVVVTYKYIFKERVVIGLTKIVKNLICMVVFGTVTFWACSVIKFSGWTSFVIKVIICIILPNISFGLVECKTKEFSFLKGKVKETIFRGNC
jgi:peptidoglycan biosynthesis protein MviN/MurJ (putative lipid II flippase)